MVSRDTREIFFRYRGDASELQGASRNAGRSLGNTSAAFTTAKRAAIGFIGVLGAREVARGAYDAAQMAGQYRGVSESFDKVYGESAPRLRAELDDVRKSVGLNSLETERLLLKNGNLLKGMGFTEEQAASMAQQFFLAAGDMAAFQGDTALTGDAVHALGRALVGEFDPLEQFLGGIKQSTVDQRALELGLADTTSEVTQQDRAIALLEEVLIKGADAAGTLSERQGTLEDKANRANAKLEDQKIILGEALIPFFSELIDLLTTAMPILTGVASVMGWFAQQASRLFGVINSIIDLFSGPGSITEKFKAFADAIANFFTYGNGERVRAWFDSAFGPAARFIERIAASFGRLKSSILNFKFPQLNLPSFLPRFHSGGVVPGPRGAEVPIMAQAGETVLPIGAKAGGGGNTYHVTVQTGTLASPVETAREIVDLLRLYERNVGPLPS